MKTHTFTSDQLSALIQFRYFNREKMSAKQSNIVLSAFGLKATRALSRDGILTMIIAKVKSQLYGTTFSARLYQLISKANNQLSGIE